MGSMTFGIGYYGHKDRNMPVEHIDRMAELDENSKMKCISCQGENIKIETTMQKC